MADRIIDVKVTLLSAVMPRVVSCTSSTIAAAGRCGKELIENMTDELQAVIEVTGDRLMSNLLDVVEASGSKTCFPVTLPSAHPERLADWNGRLPSELSTKELTVTKSA